MTRIIPPHGAHPEKGLVERIKNLEEIDIGSSRKGDGGTTGEGGRQRGDGGRATSLTLTSLEAADLIMLGTGAYTPLQGFMNRADYTAVIETMHLSDGTLWPLPIVLSASAEEAEACTPGTTVRLKEEGSEKPLGSIRVAEIFPREKEKEADQVFGTVDTAHPGVQKLMESKDYCIAGEITLHSEGDLPSRFPEYARPAETRALFAERGWKKIAAFQTRNPMHRSHEYLTKTALETMDGVFIHPVVGKLKENDIPAEVRIACYKELLAGYYPEDRVILRVYPLEMRYAGPREAVLHAIIRQNFGCSHIIIGRDHAGVGDYYGPYEAQEIFDGISKEELAIGPIKAEWAFWCQRCSQMATKKTCPHGEDDHIHISGTKLRSMLTADEEIPGEISRPEVVEVLKAYMEEKNKKKNKEKNKEKTK